MPRKANPSHEGNKPDAPIEYTVEFIQPSDTQIASWRAPVFQGARLPALIGNCPKCSHECRVEVTDVIIQGGVPASSEPAPIELMTRQVICNCRSSHQQPSGVPGCGRYWLAALRLQNDGSYALSVQTDISLISPAAALNEELAKQDERIQGTAEKWIGAVTAIYGLFSLTGIATAPKALSGLSTVSMSLVAFVLVTGLVCAGFALASGYVAAYGWLKAVSVRNDKELQEWHAELRGYAANAARRLQRAVLLSFCSLGTLAVVMLLVWFLPRHSS